MNKDKDKYLKIIITKKAHKERLLLQKFFLRFYYNGKLYKFTTDHATGVFDGTDADEVTVTDEMVNDVTVNGTSVVNGGVEEEEDEERQKEPEKIVKKNSQDFSKKMHS